MLLIDKLTFSRQNGQTRTRRPALARRGHSAGCNSSNPDFSVTVSGLVRSNIVCGFCVSVVRQRLCEEGEKESSTRNGLAEPCREQPMLGSAWRSKRNHSAETQGSSTGQMDLSRV